MNERSSSPVRPSAIAGTWYPGEPARLRSTIEAYLRQAAPAGSIGRVLGLVAPHAGYQYSGAVAAHAYRQLQGMDVRRVVLLGPLHRPVWGSPLGAYNVPSEAAFRTPLGDVPIDHPFLASLSADVPLTFVRGDEEHSLEIQLPFLQVVLGEFQLVPIMIADQVDDPAAVQRLAQLVGALADRWDDTTIIVASTDLAHLHDYSAVRRTDERLIEGLRAFDASRLATQLAAGSAQACGAVGLLGALQVAQRLGANRVEILAYSTSGDVTGDRRPGVYTVGYLAAALCAADRGLATAGNEAQDSAVVADRPTVTG